MTTITVLSSDRLIQAVKTNPASTIKRNNVLVNFCNFYVTTTELIRTFNVLVIDNILKLSPFPFLNQVWTKSHITCEDHILSAVVEIVKIMFGANFAHLLSRPL